MRIPQILRIGLVGIVLLAALSVLLAAGQPRQPASPQAYLAAVIDWIEANAAYTDRVDWPAVRQEAQARAQDARTTEDTYPTIRWVLKQLGDRHSFFLTPEEARGMVAGTTRDFGLFFAAGAVIARVDPDGPAAAADLRVGDVIVAVDGYPMSGQEAWQRYTEAPAVELTVQRAGESDPVRAWVARAEHSHIGVPVGQRLEPGIGYVEVPHAVVADISSPAAAALATRLQQVILEVDREPTCGWIVDLRRNTGGNHWPMLAGIGPVLGEGEVGLFTGRRGPGTRWAYEGGAALASGQAVVKPTGAPYILERPMPPVAVLTGPLTGSAGETMAVAFRGRADTRTFGEPTHGVPTNNWGMTLSDGAQIWLSAEVYADRTGQTYDDRIAPDEPVTTQWGDFGSERDAVIQSAAQWLRDHPACQA
jgi:carboxyl-terminal processing protease